MPRSVLRRCACRRVAPSTLAELQREMVHLRFINQQIKQIEDARQKQLEDEPQKGSNARVLELQRISGLGIETADMLVREVFSRDLRDRRAVARYAGLTGSPDESGSTGKGSRQSGQRASTSRRGPVGLALSDPSKEQHPDTMVSGVRRCRQEAHDSCSSRFGGLSRPATSCRALRCARRHDSVDR